MIATDLKINGGNGWTAAQENGSQSLMVWESTDLVNWSDQRMVEVSADIDAGCTWAPEATYDEKTGEYVVYWASKVAGDGYAKQRLYYAKTRDFYTFTEPQVFIDTQQSSIDTTIIRGDDGMYYRYTKNEGGSTNEFGAPTKTIYAQKSDSLLGGNWENITTASLNREQHVEGPTIFKLNQDDQTADQKYCLLVDNFGGIGYYPLVTDDLSDGEFSRPTTSYKMPSRARHGTPIRITAEEYENVMAAYGDERPDPEPGETTLPAKYDFDSVDGTTVKDITGNGNDATLHGDYEIRDGQLYLPGGKYGSDAGYVELPTGMFDNQNTLTISLWLKNETGAGNYAGMFFGTTETLPTGYWLLNPSNPSGNYKSVITNSYNSGAPYNTEYGFSPTVASNGITGPQTDDQWAMYTTVIQPGSITAYYNGVKLGTVETDRNVSDFGEDLVAYIGKSSYHDPFYKGGVDNVTIDTKAYTDAQVADLYYTELGDQEATQAALNEDADWIVLPDETISDLSLPTEGKNGSAISWTSSAEKYLSADGKVTRPTREEGDQTVVLTAELTLAGETITRDFEIRVLSDTPENDLKMLMQDFQLDQTVVTEDIYLPDTIGGETKVTWASDNEAYLSAEGKVTRPAVGEGDQTAVLTATVSLEGVTAEKTFEITVKEAAYGKLLTYIKEGNTDRTDALHYGLSVDGSEYTALNDGKPVLYPGDGSNKMGSPVVFLKADGTFGLLASDDDNSANVFVYESEDLINWTDAGYVKLNNQGVKVSDLSVAYDSEKQAYAVSYTGNGSQGYVVYTEDFAVFTDPEAIDYTKAEAEGTLPDGAQDAAVFEITKAEYDALSAKYGRVNNTGVNDFSDIVVEKDTDMSTVELPDTLTATYSD